MTKVLRHWRPVGWLAWCLLVTAVWAQTPADHCPQKVSDLYSRLRTVGLDPARVYRVREASINRPNLQLTFDSGTLAFTEDICGRITGAFFEGEGEILLQPPNQVERGSLALFTGMAILEEQFTSAYLRFNDDTAELLEPFLTPAVDAGGFLSNWGDVAQRAAGFDGLRLLLDFSHFLGSPLSAGDRPRQFAPLLHAHLLGTKSGAFEVFWDATLAEPLWAGKPVIKDGSEFFDIWTSFAPGSGSTSPSPRANDVAITNFRIRASVQPPTELEASAEMSVQVRKGGERTLFFELSRFLKVDSVVVDDRRVDFIQNPAIEGTELRRHGNDLVAVIFPGELKAGQELKLRFEYAGEVLSEAGNGLLYVGARGTWYPNFGLSPAAFDIEFRYPANWTLLATGKQVSHSGREAQPGTPVGEKVARWVSERPIPVAGFNLGKYVRAEARAGNVLVEAYSTKGVERTFPKAPPEVVETPSFPAPPRLHPSPPILVTPPPPSPARDAQPVADRAAKAIANFAQWFGPYPYGSLAFTQMPGDLSQGWPGLVFLSSFAFLNPQEQLDLHLNPVARVMNTQVLVHETAHQWWGDLVLWKTYHDQWVAEGLANYSAMLFLERQNPVQFRQVLDKYRSDLLTKNMDGEPVREAGPVTLGQRLVSSHFPEGYDAIAYERGTWLFHMLRSMLRDSEATSRPQKVGANPDEPFFRALRKVRERYAGKSISTHELIEVFEEELPRPLWYQNHHKLDWFVEGWINGTATPELSTRDVRITERASRTTVAGVIVQKDAPENLVTAVPVYGELTSNAMVFLGEVLADGPETQFELAAPAHVRKVVIDPKQTILATAK